MNKEEKNSNKCPTCGKPTHKDSKYCIFHASAEEKTEDEFKKRLKKYVQEIKKEDKNYNFKRFIFIGDIDFKKDLNISIFKNAVFKGATFEGDARFWGATFEGDADFRRAIFKEHADFRRAIFEEYANFLETTFKEIAFFENATFKGHTYFGKAIISGKAYFWGATFKKDISFNEVTFKGDANFELKYLDNTIDFTKIRIFSGIKISIKIINEGGIIDLSRAGLESPDKIINEGAVINFSRACLENSDLDIKLLKNAVINFSGAILKNTKINKRQLEGHIFQEKIKNYNGAKEIYLLIKNNFHSLGQYEDESWAYKKEKDMERFSFSLYYYKGRFFPPPCYNENNKEGKKYSILKWIKEGHFKNLIISAFSNRIYGYGERPWNVVITSVVIILLFSLFFTFNGIGNPETVELHGDISLSSNQDLEIILKGSIKNTKIMQFFDCLYFSLITFTTLGYGDFRPLEGWGRILAGSEAFIGAFMMALFVYTFARRTGGR